MAKNKQTKQSQNNPETQELQNLKLLNSRLLKETAERRKQVAFLINEKAERDAEIQSLKTSIHDFSQMVSVEFKATLENWTKIAYDLQKKVDEMQCQMMSSEEVIQRLKNVIEEKDQLINNLKQKIKNSATQKAEKLLESSVPVASPAPVYKNTPALVCSEDGLMNKVENSQEDDEMDDFAAKTHIEAEKLIESSSSIVVAFSGPPNKESPALASSDEGQTNKVVNSQENILKLKGVMKDKEMEDAAAHRHIEAGQLFESSVSVASPASVDKETPALACSEDGLMNKVENSQEDMLKLKGVIKDEDGFLKKCKNEIDDSAAQRFMEAEQLIESSVVVPSFGVINKEMQAVASSDMGQMSCQANRKLPEAEGTSSFNSEKVDASKARSIRKFVKAKRRSRPMQMIPETKPQPMNESGPQVKFSDEIYPSSFTFKAKKSEECVGGVKEVEKCFEKELATKEAEQQWIEKVREKEELAEKEREMEGLRRELEGMKREKKDIEGEKDGLICELEKEVCNLNEIISGLRNKESDLLVKISDLERSFDDAIEKEEALAEEIKGLVEKNEEKEVLIGILMEKAESDKKRIEETVKENIKIKKKTGFWAILSSAAIFLVATSLCCFGARH